MDRLEALTAYKQLGRRRQNDTCSANNAVRSWLTTPAPSKMPSSKNGPNQSVCQLNARFPW
jgi:hypothetical protein